MRILHSKLIANKAKNFLERKETEGKEKDGTSGFFCEIIEDTSQSHNTISIGKVRKEEEELDPHRRTHDYSKRSKCKLYQLVKDFSFWHSSVDSVFYDSATIPVLNKYNDNYNGTAEI